MTTLSCIESAGKKIASYKKANPSKVGELDKAIVYLREAYKIVKRNGGK